MRAEELVKQVETIFSLPEIVMQVNQALQQAEPNIVELEHIIVHDPGLTASILKIVNSALYGLPCKIDTVSRAIAILGLRALSTIVMGTVVTHRFKGIESHLMNMDVFWYHSVTRGVLARDLAMRCKRSNGERFFIAGLLSSIGKLIVFTQLPEQAADIIRLGPLPEAELAEAERRTLGFDYAELSAELLKGWQLPEEIWGMIAYQLNPLQSPHSVNDACILHLASSIANSIQPCLNYDLDSHPLQWVVDDEVLARLQLDQEHLQAISLEAMFQAMEIIAILRPETMVIF